MSKHNYLQLPEKCYFRSARVHQYLVGNGMAGTGVAKFIKKNDYQFIAYIGGTLAGQFDMPDYIANDASSIDWHNCPLYKNHELMAEGDRIVACVRTNLVIGTIEKINLEQKNLAHLTCGGVKIREDGTNKGWSYNRDYYAEHVKEARKLPLDPP